MGIRARRRGSARVLAFLIVQACLLLAAAMAPAGEPPAWEPVVCPLATVRSVPVRALEHAGRHDEKDTFPNALRRRYEQFETVGARPGGQVLDDFEKGPAGWRVLAGGQQAAAKTTISHEEKHGGQASLRVDYEFVGKKDYEYVELARSAEFDKPGTGLGLWVKGDASGVVLRLRIQDRSGETHQPDLIRLDFRGWRYVAVLFGSPAGSWGGDGNGRLDYPCKLYSLVADRPRQGYKGTGTIYVDDVQRVKAAKVESLMKIQARPKVFGNVYSPGQTLALRAEAPQGKVAWRVEDAEGKAIGAAYFKTKGGELTLEIGAGFYRALAERSVEGKVVERQSFTCAGVVKPSPEQRNSFVGVGTHFGQGHYPLACMDLLVRLGVTEFRDEVSWSGVERKKDQLALPEHAREFTDYAARVGLRPLLIFDYSNGLYEDGGFPTSPESVAAFARYSAALAGWLKGKVDQFEVWNEYSIGCGMSGKPRIQTPARYAAMLQATWQAVRKARPDATIVGVGGEHSAHHVKFIQGMLQAGAGKNMHAWSVHSYRYPQSPEATDLRGEIRRVIDLGVRHGAPPRLWVTEIGWPTHIGPRGVDEYTQACYLARTYALLSTVPQVRKVHWYDLKDDGLNRNYNENNFGVIRHHKFNGAPKPAAVAMSVFAQATAGAKFEKLWQDGPCWAVYYRLPGGDRLIVAWSAGKDVDVRLVPEEQGSRLNPANVRNMMGTTINQVVRIRRESGESLPLPKQLALRLTGGPVYIVGSKIKLEKP